MGIGDNIGKAVGAQKQLTESKKEQRRMRADRERALGIAAEQDWEPTYMSDHMPAYERSTSPLADAFLESMLTGDNPNAVQGTRAGAPQLQAAAQGRSDRRFGPADALLAKQREMEASQPWKVKPFEEPVIGDEERFNAQNSMAVDKFGINQQDLDALHQRGMSIDPRTGKITANTKGLRGTATDLNKANARGDTGGLKALLSKPDPKVPLDLSTILRRG